MAKDFDSVVKELVSYCKDNKYKQLLLSMKTNQNSAIELCRGIDQDNSTLLNDLMSLKDADNTKLQNISNLLVNVHEKVTALSIELNKGVFEEKKIIQLCADLVQSKNLAEKAIGNLDKKGFFQNIRQKGGLFKKVLIMLGLAAALNQANPNTSNAYAMPNKAVNSTELTTNNYNAISNAIIETAQQQLGKRYVWGAVGPNTFDCSGLIQYVYGMHGIQMPRMAKDQERVGDKICSRKIESTKLIPGDLLFFRRDSRGGRHVGIYVGSKTDDKGNIQLMMIHAPGEGKTVRYENVNKRYWENRFTSVKRVLGSDNLYASR